MKACTKLTAVIYPVYTQYCTGTSICCFDEDNTTRGNNTLTAFKNKCTIVHSLVTEKILEILWNNVELIFKNIFYSTP